MDNNLIKINVSNEYVGKSIYVVKLADVDALKLYNTEKFAQIIADKWAIVNANNYRVINELNPHICEQLTAERCNNWKVDGTWHTILTEYFYTIPKAGAYTLNTDNGDFKKTLERGEIICKNCGGVISKSQRVGRYCINCLKSIGYIERYGYHEYNDGYAIYENIDEQKTPVFGCEIERDYTTCNNFDSNLKTALLEIFKTFHEKDIKTNKTIKREFVFMRDGSLNSGGCEWITFPHTYKWYKANANKLQECIEIFKKYNFANSCRVGNHIHINNAYFKDNSKLVACKLALIFSMYWDELKHISKRESTSYTQKPKHQKNDDIFTLAEKTINTWTDHNVAVNTQHRKTTEIRLWGGIDNVQDLLLLLDVTQALTIYARKKSVESIQKSKFEDIFKYLTDKAEHIPVIIQRLEDKSIAKHTKKLNQLLNKGGV